MPAASPSELPGRVAVGVIGTWRRLNFEQRVAGIGALLLIVSTFGPFSFVEAAIALVGLSILFLLRRRAEGREFHLPFGDGAVIAAAGAWSGVLILIRVFDRPLGQGLLALVCAAILIVSGIAERRKHLPDDLPSDADGDAAGRQRDARTARLRDDEPPVTERRRRTRASGVEDAPTAVRERRPAAREPVREQLFDPESGTIDELRSVHDAPTEPLPPPEYDPPARRPGRDESDPPPPPPPPPPPDEP